MSTSIYTTATTSMMDPELEHFATADVELILSKLSVSERSGTPLIWEDGREDCALGWRGLVDHSRDSETRCSLGEMLRWTSEWSDFFFLPLNTP